jgi:hypothetical protein
MAPVADLLAEMAGMPGTVEAESRPAEPVARGRHRRCPVTVALKGEPARAGLAGTGTIIDVIETGSVIEGVPVIWVTLLVECADRLPYRVQADALLPRHAQAQARIGERVALLIDAGNDHRVLVRWGRPLT